MPMSQAFEGTINVDIRDSVPDWARLRAAQRCSPASSPRSETSVGHAVVGLAEFLERRPEGHEPAADLLRWWHGGDIRTALGGHH
jgi:hypothetical protein